MLREDEHRVPTHLGARVPLFPWLWPFDWTQRQVYWFVMCLWIGAETPGPIHNWDNVWTVLKYTGLGVLGIILEYCCRPTPEFWISVHAEYLSLLLMSFPMWWKRLLPARGIPQVEWPLAALPHWVSHQFVSKVEVLNDGVLRNAGRLGRKPQFAVSINITPKPHPDMLPMLLREGIIQSRLNIYKLIRGKWSIHMQVRPFDSDKLRIGAGPAWEWAKTNVAPTMVERDCALVLYGPYSESLTRQADEVITRFHDVQIQAARHTRKEANKLVAHMWSDTGIVSSTRVRIGVRRIVAGLHSYRSWVITQIPGVIHLAWLRPITSQTLLCDVAIHVNRRPDPASRRSLERRIRQWHAVIGDENYAEALEDAQITLGNMRRRVDTEITIGMYVTARSEQEQKVQEAIDSTQAESQPSDFYQHRALRATRTLGGDPVDYKMHADLRTVATTDLFATAGYWPEGATLIAQALSAPEPIGLNPFDEQNMNWATLLAFMQGAGKSTLAQVLAWRMAMHHPEHLLRQTQLRIVSVDFKVSGDYRNLYKHLNERGHKADYDNWSGGTLPAIEGHIGFNLSDIDPKDHGTRLLELTQRLEDWSRDHFHEGQILLIIDEILALRRVEGGSQFLSRFGTQGRSLRIAPVFCTQDVDTVMRDEDAALALKNCATVILGRQNPAGVQTMAPILSLDHEAQTLLATAPQGAGIMRIERKDGPVLLGLRVMPTDWELAEFGTNPSERIARWQREHAIVPTTDEGKEENTNGMGSTVLAGDGRDGVRLGVRLGRPVQPLTNGVGHE